jgi:hypothetical protein
MILVTLESMNPAAEPMDAATAAADTAGAARMERRILPAHLPTSLLTIVIGRG